jgi:branched-subunit amino acid aminotransferase/4-amino-4-deoxychorismate lyase
MAVRPAPPLGAVVRLWDPQEPDDRKRPDVKGIDLGWLTGLRSRAVDQGADEALVLDADGFVGEGSTTSILWWRDGILCAPPDGDRILPGVTRGLLIEASVAAGYSVRFERARPDDLDGLEVWAVNALHGVRPVVGWSGSPFEPGTAVRAGEGSAWLRRLDRLLDEHLISTLG